METRSTRIKDVLPAVFLDVLTKKKYLDAGDFRSLRSCCKTLRQAFSLKELADHSLRIVCLALIQITAMQFQKSVAVKNQGQVTNRAVVFRDGHVTVVGSFKEGVDEHIFDGCVVMATIDVMFSWQKNSSGEFQDESASIRIRLASDDGNGAYRDAVPALDLRLSGFSMKDMLDVLYVSFATDDARVKLGEMLAIGFQQPVTLNYLVPSLRERKKSRARVVDKSRGIKVLIFMSSTHVLTHEANLGIVRFFKAAIKKVYDPEKQE